MRAAGVRGGVGELAWIDPRGPVSWLTSCGTYRAIYDFSYYFVYYACLFSCFGSHGRLGGACVRWFDQLPARRCDPAFRSSRAGQEAVAGAVVDGMGRLLSPTSYGGPRGTSSCVFDFSYSHPALIRGRTGGAGARPWSASSLGSEPLILGWGWWSAAAWWRVVRLRMVRRLWLGPGSRWLILGWNGVRCRRS